MSGQRREKGSRSVAGVGHALITMVEPHRDKLDH